MSGETKTEVLYYRTKTNFNRKVPGTSNENCSTDQEHFFSGNIPRKENGKIDWATLLPRWEAVILCGSLLQVNLKGSKIFTFYTILLIFFLKNVHLSVSVEKIFIAKLVCGATKKDA